MSVAVDLLPDSIAISWLDRAVVEGRRLVDRLQKDRTEKMKQWLRLSNHGQGPHFRRVEEDLDTLDQRLAYSTGSLKEMEDRLERLLVKTRGYGRYL